MKKLYFRNEQLAVLLPRLAAMLERRNMWDTAKHVRDAAKQFSDEWASRMRTNVNF